MSDSDSRIILAEQGFQLLSECQDEADMEYIILALGDPRISTPSLRLGRGTGSVNASKADLKHIGTDWNLMKPYDKRYGVIATTPLRVAVRRNIPAGIEYRMSRKVNPLRFHEAVSIGFGQLKLIMKAKKFIGAFVDPENERLFDSLTRNKLRQHTVNQLTLSI